MFSIAKSTPEVERRSMLWMLTQRDARAPREQVAQIANRKQHFRATAQAWTALIQVNQAPLGTASVVADGKLAQAGLKELAQTAGRRKRFGIL